MTVNQVGKSVFCNKFHTLCIEVINVMLDSTKSVKRKKCEQDCTRKGKGNGL